MKKILRFFILFIFALLISGCHDSEHTFLILSDIHFDPFAACPTDMTPCPLIQALQKAPVTDWDNLFKPYLHTISSKIGQDTNIALLNATFAEIDSLPKNYDFVLIPGDFLAHDFKNQFIKMTNDTNEKDYQQFVNKTFAYLYLRLQKTFPNKIINIAFGNNDTYGKNYSVTPQGQFYQQMSALWHKTNVDTFKRAGYYTVDLAHHNTIIVLNSVLFSTRVSGIYVQTAAFQELKWLRQQLLLAKNQHQHVWIITHIPNGIDVYTTIHSKQITPMWQQTYNHDFLTLLAEYSDTVNAVITSHVHMDGFQMLLSDTQTPIIDTFVPAISPIYGNNPAFKIYHYDPSTLRLTNFTTYYFDMKKQHWKKEYDFNKIYPARDFLHGYRLIQKTGWYALWYKRYYSVGTKTQYIAQGYWLPYYWCALYHQTVEGYAHCKLDASIRWRDSFQIAGNSYSITKI